MLMSEWRCDGISAGGVGWAGKVMSRSLLSAP